MANTSNKLSKGAFVQYVSIAARLAVEGAMAGVADRFASGTSAGLKRVGDRLDSVDQQLGILRDHASDQKDEIARLREGYDWVIFKRFALRLVHMVDNLSTRIAHHGIDTEAGDALESARLEIIILLESNDVVEWAPEEHALFEDHRAWCEIVRTQPAAHDEVVGEILKTTRPGFLLESPDANRRMLKAAQVVVAAKAKDTDAP